MPELPEVEIVRRNLDKWLLGRTVTKIRTSGRHRGVADTEIAPIRGHRIDEIRRLGKYLTLRFSTQFLIIHLGMSGRFVLREAGILDSSEHDHVEVWLDNHVIIAFQDHRRFGRIFTSPLDLSALPRIGPDALQPRLAAKDLMRLLGNRTSQLKPLLMNQSIVAGIGNIYASEILWGARLSPLRSARTLEGDDYRRLARSIADVLRRSIEFGGATLDDYRNTNGALGTYDQHFSVYARADKPCQRCGLPIVSQTLAGRATYWCKGCQI